MLEEAATASQNRSGEPHGPEDQQVPEDEEFREPYSNSNFHQEQYLNQGFITHNNIKPPSKGP
eukprot:1924217-Prorocentrum_lima.AAC.1